MNSPRKSILTHVLIAFMVLLVPLASLAAGHNTNERTITGPSKQEMNTGMVILWMPGGSFVYGCPGGDCVREEGLALETVTLSGFWMGRDRVSVAEYQACIAAGTCTALGENLGCSNRKPSVPVTCVSYTQAQAFCAWVGGSLPTEQQWEFAADSGYEMNWEYGVNAQEYSGGASEWAIPSSPLPRGYEAVRGGTEDMEPMYNSDRGSATPELQSKSISFRCVWGS